MSLSFIYDNVPPLNVFLLYILEKHKDVATSTPFLVTHDYSSETITEVDFFRLGMLGDKPSGGTYSSIVEYIDKKVDKNQIRFVLVPLTEIFETGQAHACMFILDLPLKQIYYIDPSNKEPSSDDDPDDPNVCILVRTSRLLKRVNSRARLEKYFKKYFVKEAYSFIGGRVVDCRQVRYLDDILAEANHAMYNSMCTFISDPNLRKVTVGYCVPLAFMIADTLITFHRRSSMSKWGIPEPIEIHDFVRRFMEHLHAPTTFNKGYQEYLLGDRSHDYFRVHVQPYAELMDYCKTVLVDFRTDLCRRRFKDKKNFAGLPDGDGWHGWAQSSVLETQGYTKEDIRKIRRREVDSISTAIMELLGEQERF